MVKGEEKSMKKFPNNYMASIVNFKMMMTNSIQYSWWQILIIFPFLTSLLSVPITIYLSVNSYTNLATIMPTVAAKLENDTKNRQIPCKIIDTKLNCTDSVNDELVSIVQSEDGITGSQGNYTTTPPQDKIILAEEYLYVLDQSGVGFKLAYTEDFSFSVLTDKELSAQLESLLNTQQNNTLTVLNIVITFLMLSVNNVLFVFGAAVFIYITKFSGMNDIKNYRQSVAIVLSTYLLPVVTVTTILLFSNTITLAFILPQGLMLIMILILFVRTKFRIDATVQQS